ncbi:small multi-drug export protein [Methanolapillus millepedarum]|uniref:Small multi-drug export protein n=1 Tax=Methanolapillus millepedarum TaxID=3028296 RepID=A0AA96ZTT6_9EURY|nr:hypothetical protein MsAc7_04970 [Methanosarcinaceae archaeon Ac7]
MDFATPIIELLAGVPHWIIVTFLAMVPVVELRGAIPVGIGLFGMNPLTVLVLSVVGNMLPVAIIFYFLDPVSKFLSKHSKLFAKFFDWLFSRAEKKGKQNIERYKDLALMVFVAIPLPLTGAWTGTVIALVFGYPFKNAFISILLGVIIAGIIVTVLTMTGVHVWDLFTSAV